MYTPSLSMRTPSLHSSQSSTPLIAPHHNSQPLNNFLFKVQYPYPNWCTPTTTIHNSQSLTHQFTTRNLPPHSLPRTITLDPSNIRHSQFTMVWLWLVRSIKLYVSLAKEPYKRDHILQKRHMILSILLHVGLCPYPRCIPTPIGASLLQFLYPSPNPTQLGYPYPNW